MPSTSRGALDAPSVLVQLFPCLQFIVVSLKEGMFQNANVLFRTKFVDGVSMVERVIVADADCVGSSKAAAGRRAALRENVRA